MKVMNRTIIALIVFVLFFGLAAEGKNIATKDIKDLKTALKTGLPVVAKLGADWCPPCRAMKPILRELAAEQDGKIVFLDLDVNKYRDLAKEFKISLIPTIIYYNKSGKAVTTSTGFISKEDLLKKIKALKLNK